MKFYILIIILMLTSCTPVSENEDYDTSEIDKKNNEYMAEQGNMELRAERDEEMAAEMWELQHGDEEIYDDLRRFDEANFEYAEDHPGYLNSCHYGCTVHEDGCDIKGNISFESGEKIYHLPGMEFYEETEINIKNGERWFCTEQDAIENGWRKSKQ